MATASLRALLARVIDYAGLFPPAKLPLDRAVHAYAEYHEQPESWMLGRFIIPASRLPELDAHAKLLRAGPPWTFSCLGRGGSTTGEFLPGLRDDLRDIDTFRQKYAAEIDVLETRLPGDVLGQGVGVAARLFGDAAAILEEKGPPILKPFYEAPLRPAWREEVNQVLDALAQDAKTAHPPRRSGFKLRTGGLEASAFPSVEQVSHVITAAVSRRVSLKFTAGLHHPVRRYDAGVQATMHGFLNFFAAGALTLALGPDEDMVRQVVEQTDASAFRFEETELSCGPFRAPLALIDQARRDAVLSFGSCSFDEPRDDLRALGLM